VGWFNEDILICVLVPLYDVNKCYSVALGSWLREKTSVFVVIMKGKAVGEVNQFLI
jgi:hypothetical protein